MTVTLKPEAVVKIRQLADQMREKNQPWVSYTKGDASIRLTSSRPGTVRIVKSRLVGTLSYLAQPGEELDEGNVLAAISMLGIINEEHLPLKVRVLEHLVCSGISCEYSTALMRVEIFPESEEALKEIEQGMDKKHGPIYFYDPTKEYTRKPVFVPTRTTHT